jgi:hypothetical protein
MTDLQLVVSGYPGIRPTELDQMTRELAADIQRHTRLTAQPQSSAPAAGSKSGTAVDIGKLVLTGVFSANSIKALCSVLKVWIEHRRAGLIKIRDGDREVEIHGTSKEISAALDHLSELWKPAD